MASLQNRSPLVVTVAHRPKARREFRFDQPEKADEYMAKLKAAAAFDGKTIEVKLSQLDTSWEVRIRQRGYKPVNITAGSLADANKLVDKVKSDRAHGLVIDYTKAHHVTFAELMVMHIDKHKRPKTFGHDFYKVAAWLRDSGSEGVALLAAFQAEREAAGKPLPPLKFRVAQSMENLEWIHKKFAHIEAQDITDYVEAREDQVGPATVDREIDVFRLIVNRATKSWGYRVAADPIEGVERPKYDNGRDRRLRSGEEEKLVEQARREDLERAITERVEQWVADEFGAVAFSSNSAKKKVLAARRQELQGKAAETVAREAEGGQAPTPWMEAFLQFQLMTAARRGDALKALWRDIDVEARTALLRETKNLRSRKAPLRSALLALLARLPHDTDEVFPLGVKWLANTWKRMCENAGIEGLRIHDLRHEAISRVAETGSFTMLDLAAFSGHRDLAMLQRYAHLCATKMAHKLDEAFADEERYRMHKGRKFLTKEGRKLHHEVLEEGGGGAQAPASAAAAAPKAMPAITVVPCAFGLQWPAAQKFTVVYQPTPAVVYRSPTLESEPATPCG